jgi:hypothetical protein
MRCCGRQSKNGGSRSRRRSPRDGYGAPPAGGGGLSAARRAPLDDLCPPPDRWAAKPTRTGATDRRSGAAGPDPAGAHRLAVRWRGLPRGPSAAPPPRVPRSWYTLRSRWYCWIARSSLRPVLASVSLGTSSLNAAACVSKSSSVANAATRTRGSSGRSRRRPLHPARATRPAAPAQPAGLSGPWLLPSPRWLTCSRPPWTVTRRWGKSDPGWRTRTAPFSRYMPEGRPVLRTSKSPPAATVPVAAPTVLVWRRGSPTVLATTVTA